MMRLSLLIVRLLFQSCQTFGQNEAFSPPTPSPVNWSLLHLNKLGIMKRCFHSVIIINHDSGLPCILGLATQMFSKNTNDEEPGTNSSMKCLPSHNLIFLIDRKIQTSSLSSVIVLTYLLLTPISRARSEPSRRMMLQGRAFLLYFPKGFLPVVGFWSARPLTFRRLKNLSILAHAGNQRSHWGSAHSPFYLLMGSGLVGASFPSFPTKTYFRFRRIEGSDWVTVSWGFGIQQRSFSDTST